MNRPTRVAVLEKQSARAIDTVRRSLKRRHAAERRFRLYGRLAIAMAIIFLAALFLDIVHKGYSAFEQTFVGLDVYFDPDIIDPHGTRNPEVLAAADYTALIKSSLRELFPEVRSRGEKRRLYAIVSSGASFRLGKMVLNNPAVIGNTVRVWVPADDEIDMLVKGHVDRESAESERRLSNQQIAWVDRLTRQGRIEKRFNTTFFTAGDSRDPELAGISGAVAGSFFMLLVTLVLSFPIGVATAVYLEEFAPTNKWTDLIEVNINNLAAVPSIVFGLLGLAVFINFFGLPRSAPLVGGLVLTLMT